MKRTFFLSLLMMLTIISCKDSGTYKPNISGFMGEVIIVMNERVKNSQGGQYLCSMFRQNMQGLPQDEQLFKLSVVSPTAFSDHLKIFRNIVIVTVSPDVEKEGVKYYNPKDVWAKEQALMSIEAKNLDSFNELVEKYEVRILGFFLSAERNRNLNYYKKNSNPELMKTISETFGFNMVIPSSYKENSPKSGENFKWFSLETPLTSESVMIYDFDYTDESAFSKEYLLNKRDSVLKANIPGVTDGSYMATEYNFPITYKTFTVNGHETVEIRGLWKVIGDLMGGPFVLFAHHDKDNNRVVVTDSYVFAPEKPDKRNYVLKVESLLYSVKFPEKSDENNN
jgi:hypothetical protein